MATFKRPRNLEDIVVRARSDNPLLKSIKTPDVCCASTTLTRAVLLPDVMTSVISKVWKLPSPKQCKQLMKMLYVITH